VAPGSKIQCTAAGGQFICVSVSVYSVVHLGPSKPAFKTRFAFNERGISPKHKETNNEKKILTTVVPLLIRGAMARASGAKVPGKHDDKVLVQVVLTTIG
jgi:hypothetical protein